MNRPAKILVFDSGLGGLTVFARIAEIRPNADFLYCADDAAFPYGSWSEDELAARVLLVMERLIGEHAPDIVVIACNTASTLALPQLRGRWPKTPFVGTVPAIKPAAQISQTRQISVLATPGTVARDYTQKLIAEFAGHCAVTLVGSKRLAGFAERVMHGESVADGEIAAEIAPCFTRSYGERTDAIVLACTHYPLLLGSLARLAPWPVAWIDPAPAIARRADHVLGERFDADAPLGRHPLRRALFTSGAAQKPSLEAVLAAYGLAIGEAPASALIPRTESFEG